MSISELFRYRNEKILSDIFCSDIGIRDVDVGYRISPTSRPMSMPTYGYVPANFQAEQLSFLTPGLISVQGRKVCPLWQ
jgi:hypothetical protein